MLLGASAVLTMVGISLFFERTLLRLANVSHHNRSSSIWLLYSADASFDAPPVGSCAW